MFLNIFLELGIFLVLLLALLLLLLFLRAKEKKARSSMIKEKSIMDLESIVKKISSEVQSVKELEILLALVLDNYGSINHFHLYREFIIALVLNPHTNKNLILSFDKELSKRNPEYKKRISDTIVEALSLR